MEKERGGIRRGRTRRKGKKKDGRDRGKKGGWKSRGKKEEREKIKP